MLLLMARDRDATPAGLADDALTRLARLADLARTAVQTQVSLAKQSADLTRATWSGDLDRTSAGKAYFEAVAREGARYWRAAGELGVDYATDLLALGNHLSTTVLRETAAAGRGARPGRPQSNANGNSNTDANGNGNSDANGNGNSSTNSNSNSNGNGSSSTQATFSRTIDGPLASVPADTSARRVQVALHGSVGQVATGTITVANQHPRPRRIQLEAGDVLDSTGATVTGILNVTPTSVTVPSGQERSVGLTVDLDEVSFSAGKRYSCTVEVSGGDEATIEVTIDVGS